MFKSFPWRTWYIIVIPACAVGMALLGLLIYDPPYDKTLDLPVADSRKLADYTPPAGTKEIPPEEFEHLTGGKAYRVERVVEYNLDPIQVDFFYEVGAEVYATSFTVDPPTYQRTQTARVDGNKLIVHYGRFSLPLTFFFIMPMVLLAITGGPLLVWSDHWHNRKALATS